MLRISPCLPSPAEGPPSGDGWLHEIKHDGMREIVALPGDHTPALSRRAGCDGEAIVTNDDGLAVFDLIRRNVHATASSYFSMPVRSVARALCQNGLARFIAAGGRSPRWIKVKNPNAPAVTREAGGGVGH